MNRWSPHPAAPTVAVTFDDALRSALVQLCADRADLLAHAVRATAATSPLRPLGTLSGPMAVEHATLANALYRAHPPGTGLTSAVIEHRQPVWVPSISDAPVFPHRALLARHRIRSGAAFPVIVGPRVAAVVEVLSFDVLRREPALEATFAELAAGLEEVACAPVASAVERSHDPA